VPARGYEQLVVRDNGIGLTEDDMRSLLSIIGSTSKRSDVAAVRRQFLGQFGIGLLSCFLVADSIEVISRSARTPDAPTVRWVGQSDGTFTIGPALRPLAEPGTEVLLRPRHGYHRWCDTDACLQFASEFAELLAVPVRIGDTTLSQQPRPWTLDTEDQPADRPVLWWPTTPGHARMMLNAANSAVKRLLSTPPETDISAALRALYITGLLAGRATPSPAEVATLGTSVLDMVEDLLSDGS
jgi:Histidine kinase-, DNA gyrase B-, and HSP90-like ATPase